MGQSRDANSIPHLQRTIGNQAVQRRLEADSMNVKIDSAMDNACFGHEQGAYRATEQVMRMPEPIVGGSEPKERSTQTIHGSDWALSSQERSFFEPRFGHDFSQVRIHADTKSAQLADALNADAFTVGRDIYFGTGRYQPGSPTGQRLLAHELAHVVQQRASTAMAAPPAVSQHGDCAEREADRAAKAPLAGRPTCLAPGSEPPTIHRQPRQPRRADRFLPNERQSLRRLGRGELNELIDQIIADGNFHRVRQETIDGVEHIWEVKTEIVELSEREQFEGASFGGAVKPEETILEEGGKRVRHRLGYILRGGSASTLESALHELIHLRIMIDRRLPEAKRSSFYKEYAQLAEMTEVLPSASFGESGTISQKSSYGALPLVTGAWEKLKIVLGKIEAIRSFVAAQDTKVVAAFANDPELTPAALIEFITHEKYVTQTAARAVSGNAPSNEIVATRYARSVAAKFERHLSEQTRTERIAKSPVGSKLKRELVDGLRLAIQRLYDALDQSLSEAREFEKSPPSPPPDMPAPRIYESRPLGIGGEPIPLP